MVNPMTLKPFFNINAAATLLSTPPDMATATVIFIFLVDMYPMHNHQSEYLFLHFIVLYSY